MCPFFTAVMIQVSCLCVCKVALVYVFLALVAHGDGCSWCWMLMVVDAHLAVSCSGAASGSQPRTAALHGGSPYDERTGLPHRNISKPCSGVKQCETFTSLFVIYT